MSRYQTVETTRGAPGTAALTAWDVPLASLDLHWNGLSQAAAVRIVALTARSAGATCAMVHVADGRQLRLIGGYGIPDGFERTQPVPVSSTLAGLVLHFDYPLVITDVQRDGRVPHRRVDLFSEDGQRQAAVNVVGSSAPCSAAFGLTCVAQVNGRGTA